MPNPRPTPEQRAEWRRDAGMYGHLIEISDARIFATRILALLDALKEAEEELREVLERSIERRDRP